MKVLHLTLKRKWFDMVASGVKQEEYRKPSPWIFSRLRGKQYDVVRFRNGYSASSPVVDCEFKGWRLGYGKTQWGGGCEPGNSQVVIKLGKVLQKVTEETNADRH